MEFQFEEKLAQARQNRDALKNQVEVQQVERDRLNVMYLKWTGVCEYLESLETSSDSEGDAPDNGLGDEKNIPSQNVKSKG